MSTSREDEKQTDIGGEFGAGIATISDATNKFGKGIQTFGRKVLVEPSEAVAKQADQVVVKPTQKAIQGVVDATKSTGQEIGSFVSGKRDGKHRSAGAVDREAEATSSGEMALPPDEQLMSMDILFTKQLAKTSVRDWYNNFWNEMSIYKEFLEAHGKQDVVISDWEEGEIENPYDLQTYTHRRNILFHFEKSIVGRQLAPSVRKVEHYRISNDRGIVTVTTDTSGVPFSDAFQVQLRWVGTRIGENDLLLQLGFYVLFRKSVLVAGQIRSATRQETFSMEMNLFNVMKDACGAEESAMGVTVEETAWDTSKFNLCSKPPVDLFRMCIPQASEQVFQDDLDRELFEVQKLLRTVGELPMIEEQQKTMIESALLMVEDSLDSILIRKLGLEDTVAPNKEEVKSRLRPCVVTSMSSPFERIHSVVLGRTTRTKKKMNRSKLPQFLISSVTPSDKGSHGADTDPSFDRTLQSMIVVVSKSVDNATIDDFYDLLVKEDRSTEKQSLYQTWLCDSGKMEVKVGEWESNSGASKGFLDEWSKELYERRRIVSFQSPRKTNFLIQQELDVVDVKQVLYCRKETRKLVLATTEEHIHGPFSKTVKFYRRLVVSQVDDQTISFKCGIFVLFTRPLILSPKIRASETQEARRMYTELYRLARTVLAGQSIRKSLNERFEFKDIEDGATTCFLGPLEGIRRVIRLCSTPTLKDEAVLKQKFRAIHAKLARIDELLDNREANTTEDLNFYSGEMVIAREALDDVLSSTFCG